MLLQEVEQLREENQKLHTAAAGRNTDVTALNAELAKRVEEIAQLREELQREPETKCVFVDEAQFLALMKRASQLWRAG